MEFCWNFGFQISQIFWKKKTIVFAEFFGKISYPYNKTTPIIRISWQLQTGKIKKDVKNTKKSKSK